jgi:hypothetical protein
VPADRVDFVVQVVPSEGGGVYDHAQGLATAWRRDAVNGALVVSSGTGPKPHCLTDAVVRALPGTGARSGVLVHFSGYGYARRGLCFWLNRELREIRTRIGTTIPIGIVYHELFAFGAPWRSSFWTSVPQRSIARAMGRFADFAWTNTTSHGVWLKASLPRNLPVVVRPVFSNIGEPDRIKDPQERKAALAVFGSEVTRGRALSHLGGRNPFLASLGVREIVEIGPGKAQALTPPGIATRFLGHLSASEVSEVLTSCRWGLLHYPPKEAAKSGVLAAYAAHGCIVVFASTGAAADGLEVGSNFIALQDRRIKYGEVQEARLSRSIRDWYMQHRLHDQAATLLGMFQGRRD